MLRILAVFVVGVGLALTSADAQSKEPDIRQFSWGERLDTVKKTEKAQQVAPEPRPSQNLCYTEKTAGQEALLCYGFRQERLEALSLTFIEAYASPEAFTKARDAATAWLTSQYGKPVSENAVWKNYQTKPIATGWQDAFTKGNIVYLESRWRSPATGITLTLFKDKDGKPRQLIHYYPLQPTGKAGADAKK